jgi:predicted NUDIX family phosphoesterase
MPGGHINECDFENPVMNAIRRELKEELGIKDSDIKNYNFEGIIYSNIDLVSQDHIGLVYTVFLNNDNIQIAETKSLTGEWMTVKQFAQLLSDMENWCRIVFNSLLWQVT